MLGIGEKRANSESGVASLAGWIRELSWPPALRATEWLGVFQGHEIRVATRGLFRARLCIDGRLRDKRSPLLCLDRRVPLLSGRVLTAGPEVNIVYVFRRGLCPMQIEVRVAGKSIPMNEVMQIPLPSQSETPTRFFRRPDH